MGLFDLFRKAHSLQKMVEAGGNFAFIALNMATIYAVIDEKYQDRHWTLEQKLGITAICDMLDYIGDGDTDPMEILRYVKMGCKFADKGNISSVLTDVTIEIERLIFQLSKLVSDRELDMVLRDREPVIADVVRETLKDPHKSSIYREVSANVTAMITEGTVVRIVMDFMEKI